MTTTFDELSTHEPARKPRRWPPWQEAADDALGKGGTVSVVTRPELANVPEWKEAFAGRHLDYRYYELVEDTIEPAFACRYFVIRDSAGKCIAVQPFFIIDVDLLTGAAARWQDFALIVRRLWPRFMRVRTVMVGCAGGPGALDGKDEQARRLCARQLLDAALREARRAGARQVVLKEFPVQDRGALSCFLERGFVRIPSLPMSSVILDAASFDEHARCRLGRATRKNLRRKFKAAARAAAIHLTVLDDASEIVDELYPLYLQVYARSRLRFEKLTREFIVQLGRRMPDRARFFVWRQKGRVIAFSICLVAGDTIYDEYIGLDYSVAFDLHLYHLSYRDVLNWAIANGYKRYVSMGVSYRPKLHLRHKLEPLDLYVRQCSPLSNAMFIRLLVPLISPVARDKVLPRFANYVELWA